MKEVTKLIQALQARLKNAGGGQIIITDKIFNIKLMRNERSVWIKKLFNCDFPKLSFSTINPAWKNGTGEG